jgi:hypothetical protein
MRVYALTEHVTVDDASVERAIRATRPVLVVIDPIQGFISAKTNMNQANEVRAFMAHLRQLAEAYQCTILFVRHFGKSTDRTALHKALGSVDFTAIARSVLQVERTGTENRYTLRQVKSNIGPYGDALIYSIEPETLGLPDGGLVETSRIKWEDEPRPATEGATALAPEVRATLEALEICGGVDVPLRAITETLRARRSTVSKYLNQAMGAGYVSRSRYGHYSLVRESVSMCESRESVKLDSLSPTFTDSQLSHSHAEAALPSLQAA